MANKWRGLTSEEKKAYQSKVKDVNEAPLETLSTKERKEIMMRIARRHQSDVSHCKQSVLMHCIYIYQANTAEQLGFQLASMYYIDGETVTVGTKGGKAYLNSHPAILSSFQSQFLYGQFHFTIQGNCSFFLSI